MFAYREKKKNWLINWSILFAWGGGGMKQDSAQTKAEKCIIITACLPVVLCQLPFVERDKLKILSIDCFLVLFPLTLLHEQKKHEILD